MSKRGSVKVCGVTREAEIDGLALLGVERFGLVVGLNVDHGVTVERAAELVAYAGNGPRGTLVTAAHDVDGLSRLIDQTRAPAIQLAGFTSARRVARLRQRFEPPHLEILQVIHFQGDDAVEQAHIGNYAQAGVDFFIVDSVGEDGALGSTGKVIDTGALESFRARKTCDTPVLVAGGVDIGNVVELMTAAGAVGIDVSTSVRSDEGVDIDKVSALMGAML